jgi:hypothetical protein
LIFIIVKRFIMIKKDTRNFGCGCKGGKKDIQVEKPAVAQPQPEPQPA